MNENRDTICGFQPAEMMEQMMVMMNTMKNMSSTVFHERVDSKSAMPHNLESQIG